MHSKIVGEYRQEDAHGYRAIKRDNGVTEYLHNGVVEVHFTGPDALKRAQEFAGAHGLPVRDQTYAKDPKAVVRYEVKNRTKRARHRA